MTVFSKFKSLIFASPAAQRIYEDLRAADVPVSDEVCRACPDPCDQGHNEYPGNISIDMDSELLGSVKPYRRQVLISSGKSDWPKEVTDVDDTLATFLSDVNHQLGGGKRKTRGGSLGLFTSEETRRLAIQNGSHHSFSENSSHETVIVFPDFKVIGEVPRSLTGAQSLWTAALDPSHGRTGASSRTDSLKSWALPYTCAILLCSHKRRDKRCAITAPVLERSFAHYLEQEGWGVDTELEDLSRTPTLESSLPKGKEAEAAFKTQLKALEGEQKALILRCSHFGGHKYAGNVIIYYPQGTSVWYGRVTPHDVESIVKNTIINGQVLPPILRGGMNLAKPGRKSLNDW